ncbi:LytR C-terminal domain-containing protein [Rhodococcus sp. NPDC058505]|uniref:LytR C-terminal domain-containing protein n=1 Tax=unclassified Rhodococcus (in: high G+C Gram-positive bacteria) TaxID=192944 RepID=UPI0036678679
MSTPQPAPSGPPLRALAMVLIALAIAFAGIGALTLSNSGSDTRSSEVLPSVAPVTGAPNAPAASARATTPAPVSPTTLAPVAAAATPTTAAVDRSAVPVRVFNNSTVSGLAAQTAGTLESEGWTVAETGNYSSGNVAKTTAYYSANSAAERQAAQQIAADLGITAEQRFGGIATASPGVIVIVTSQ